MFSSGRTNFISASCIVAMEVVGVRQCTPISSTHYNVFQVFAEHLKYAGAKIHVLLSICFNACMVHGFLPSTTDTILVHIIKDKTLNFGLYYALWMFPRLSTG